MRFRLTIIATLLAVALCLFNATGADPHNIFFFMFSVPTWVAEMIMDIQQVNVFLMYVLTVAFWAIVGLFADYIISTYTDTDRTRRRVRRPAGER